MSKVAIVTDSTAYIPPERLEGLPVFTIPLHVIWGEQTYQDNVDIHPEEFYQRLQTEKTMPHTSQVTPEEFLRFYRPIVERGYEILSIHISTRLTTTLSSAALAVKNLPGAVVELFDSMTGSMAMGFQVLEAAKAAAQGATLKECTAIAAAAREHTNIFFIPGTLEFLHRGGRIGGASAFLGSVLQIHPILETRKGIIDAAERVRTMSAAVNRLIDLVDAKIGDQTPIHLAALHANLLEKGQELLERTRDRLGAGRVVEALLTDISPVLGVHIGPDSIGMAYMAGV